MGHTQNRSQSILRALAAFIMVAAFVWALQIAIRITPKPADGPAAAPFALGQNDMGALIGDAQSWLTERAPALRDSFEALIYGAQPLNAPTRVVTRRVLDPAAFDGLARIEAWTLETGDARAPVRWSLTLALPNKSAPKATILAGNFCGDRFALKNAYALPDPEWLPSRCRTQQGRVIATWAHGHSIIAPPVRTIVERGFALATFYPAEVAPDSAAMIESAYRRFREAGLIEDERPGVIAIWAWAYLRSFDALSSEPRLAGDGVAFWGHSRHGKAALLAGALDQRPAAIIANQSGTFGASLTRGKKGETVRAITHRFPHWFTADAKGSVTATDIDQHLLLALIAPRPLLLGNARLDKWSDPAAAFRAAEGANPVYELFGRAGLTQPNMRAFDASADIAFFLRPGGHGVRPRDWSYTLDFLDAKFPGSNPALPLREFGR